MTVDQYAKRFFGARIVDFYYDYYGDQVARGKVVYRLVQEVEPEESQRQMLDKFLRMVNPAALEALVLGSWGSKPPKGYLNGLIAHRLPRLRALFAGDITAEDCEISWIKQADYSGLIDAYPGLEVLRVRGGQGLKLPRTEYRSLRELALESGGLPSSVLEEIANARFPQLERLELWLGVERSGFDGDLDACAAVLDTIRPERLTYLGLRDSEIADDLAVHLAGQKWLGRLHTLDLSMGTLGDVGADALCASKHIKGLQVLDLRHHYISAKLIKELKRLPLKLLIDKPQVESEYGRYVQFGE